jgi:glycosyltransferase involved in cell wall biosynthesis
MLRPKVSVCVPVYNTVKYIKEAIDSILNQSYNEFELVIVDNCSTDGTSEILRTYHDSRIRLFRNECTVSVPKNWNKCLEYAEGDYVAIYHADDIYYPNIVEEEAAVLDKYPDVGAVFAFADYLYMEKIPNREMVMPNIFKEINIYDAKETINLVMRYASIFFCPTVMMRKSIIARVGGYNDHDYKWTFDLDMWLKLSRKSKLCIINKRLMKYRISASQGSSGFEASGHREHYKAVDRYLRMNNILHWFNINLLFYLKAKYGIGRKIKSWIKALIKQN